MYKHKYMFFFQKPIYINIYFNLASWYDKKKIKKKKTEKIEHDVNFIYEHVNIFEPCLTVANHKLMFELDSAARFISDKKKRLVDLFKS